MKLLSWNIQWGRGMDGRVDLARILRTIQQLGDFDVICLQEVAVNFPGLPGSRGEDQVAELSAGLYGCAGRAGRAQPFWQCDFFSIAGRSSLAAHIALAG